MKLRRKWDIHTRTQLISLGPAILLTLLLICFFTFVRIQDLRQELNHTGQLIANQLAPASEYGVVTGNTDVLEALMNATLAIPHVRFLEIQNAQDRILAYVEQPSEGDTPSRRIEVFQAPIRQQRNALKDATERGVPPSEISGELPEYLGRVIVGMSDDAFSQRQQEIVLKAGVLALFALILTFLLARRLSRDLSQPISDMSAAVTAIREGDFQAVLPVPPGDTELGELARHLNELATGLQQASHEQRVAMDELIHTREEAERANSAKSEFLAMMSHELRTPMNGVLGMLQLLETTQMTDEQKEYAALATQSTEHLLKVINDILDFSRIERANLELEHIAFDLPQLIELIAQPFRLDAEQRGLRLELEIGAALRGVHVAGDPTRIRQILVNLIGNALKFTEAGHVRIEVSSQALDHDLIWLTCTVSDTGIGISAQNLESMFVAFRQADSSISRRYGGTGLGLPIARNLAERMGGTLHADSEVGQGSTFTLELPLALSNPPLVVSVPAPARSSPNDGTKTIGTGLHVLLVEDNPVNQTVIEAMLRSLGFTVSVVGDGAQAVTEVSRLRFDAVLMDCRLPVIDGYEATRRIRLLTLHNDVPVIALTANALHGDREACIDAGMNDYLAKPFKRSDLLLILQRWIS
ncbi:ATP-binding protein [Pseudomonas baltica]|uniref:ATP-binding protein n=1 Tax=Pseudomonas baltica TaxID=2762576 RepID=UPI00289C1878|nr:ATP-binding protein [Pseudomonas baltica]